MFKIQPKTGQNERINSNLHTLSSMKLFYWEYWEYIYRHNTKIQTQNKYTNTIQTKYKHNTKIQTQYTNFNILSTVYAAEGQHDTIMWNWIIDTIYIFG